MSNRFLSLFGIGSANKDSLRQDQREAILDALNFCMYADNHLALSEDKVIDDWVGQLSWEARVSIEDYEARSIAQVRRARDDAKFKAEFLAGIGERLGDDSAKSLALKLCRQLVAADGHTSGAEGSVLSELKAGIGIR